MVSAFDGAPFNRKCCIAHTINLILQDLHQLFNDAIKLIDQIISKIKNSTLYSNICKELNHPILKIHSYSPTRWYSLYNCIHDFNISKKCIETFLSIKKISIEMTEYQNNFFIEFENL